MYNEKIKNLGLAALLNVEDIDMHFYYWMDMDFSNRFIEKIDIASANYSVDNTFLKLIKEKNQKIHYQHLSFNDYVHKHSDALKQIRYYLLQGIKVQNLENYSFSHDSYEDSYENAYKNVNAVPFYQQNNNRSKMNQHAHQAKTSFKQRR